MTQKWLSSRGGCAVAWPMATGAAVISGASAWAWLNVVGENSDVHSPKGGPNVTSI